MLKPHKIAEVQFREIREIGQEGRNSTAHVVHDVQLDTEIVMKRIPKSDMDSEDQYFEEARKLYATSHQNVVPILYACEDPESVYLALPYFQNGSLKSLLNTRNLTVREIVSLGCQLLSGMHNIHSKNLIHFDIKPDNVLLSDRGEALLSDFGLAKQMYLGRAQQVYFYTPIVAPEVVTNGPPYDLRYDIYQFGLTLYRMCVGESALRDQMGSFFEGETFRNDLFAQALTSGAYPDRSTFHEHIPDRLKKTIVRCLNVDPDERFSSALEVANSLAKIDQCLDWRFEKGAGGKSWTRTEGPTEKTFSVHQDGSTEFASTSNGGKRRRVTKYCCESMTAAQVKRVLRDEG